MKPLVRSTRMRNGLPVLEPLRESTWRNDDYVVLVSTKNPEVMPEGWTWLSVRRADRGPIRDWRDMQQIKNQLCGAEREAIEIYPAESRLMDTANQYHLWVLPPGVQVGVGYPDREVGGSEDAARYGAVQRDPDQEQRDA